MPQATSDNWWRLGYVDLQSIESSQECRPELGGVDNFSWSVGFSLLLKIDVTQLGNYLQ
jgi:hypothetical protein